MAPNFTLSDYIRYIYNEVDFPDCALIQRTIDTDPSVQVDYSKLVLSLGFLDRILIDPPVYCVDNIMQYARTA